MKNRVKPLDQSGLQELALRYVSRYATTRHKLRRYLTRKINEREWKGDDAPQLEPMIARFVELGYVDDAAFALNKAAALTNKGYGSRRVSQALYQAGISDLDGQDALDMSEKEKWQAALTYARKKAIGPFAMEQQPRDICQRQLQAFLRAGHDYDIAARLISAAPGDTVEPA